MPELDAAIRRFCDLLDAAGIRHLIGGSIASGVWGEPRQTNDVGVEVWLGSEPSTFLEAFGPDYLVSETDLSDALASREPFASVQVLDMEAILKFDCFIKGHCPIDDEMYAHSVDVLFGDRSIRVAAPEHILVQKLRWFELGNRVSERQWRDLRGIVAMNPNLDWKLIERWASACGVAETLTELRLGGS